MHIEITFRKRITEFRLKSSKKPQIRTTISVIVGSQTPLLQKPVLQGVPEMFRRKIRFHLPYPR